MLARFLLLTATILIAVSCGVERSITAADAQNTADAHSREQLPQVNWDKLTRQTEDRGAVWRIVYMPPPGSTGDPLIVEVNKRTGEITKGLASPCPDQDVECFNALYNDAQGRN